MLRIIERVGILVALTFDSGQDKTENATFEGSHIGTAVFACYNYKHLFNIHIVIFILQWDLGLLM